MTDQTSPSFRADINGLRAWAVAAVVLYHFGVPGFGGGFVGVDVFFVISGYLMTGLVLKGLERGTFSVWAFYMARARRIVPALVALCAALLLLGWLVLMPPDYKTLASHVVYALTFLSNIEFWQEAGYFDVASHEKWLLHTWSLSVEWQFYMVLPLALRLVWWLKPGRRAQVWAVGLGLLVSLGAAVVLTGSYPSAAFYLLHTRAWEMLAGGLVFLTAPKLSLSTNKRCWVESAGLLLIVLAVAQFDKTTAWPGWRATLPVLAAMMVLTANRQSIWTASRVAQWLGDRSYSLYLWHWPVVVALVYVEMRDNPLAIFGGVALTLLLGHVSYLAVENPARKALAKVRWRIGAGAIAGAALAVTAVAFAVWGQQGVGGRFAPEVELAAAEQSNINPRRGACHPNTGITSPSCVYGGTDWNVIVLGDSHAGALVSAVAQAGIAGNAGVVQWSYGGCPYAPGLRQTPIRQAYMGGAAYKCSDFLDWAKAHLDELPEHIPVVIINRYAQAAFGANEEKLLVDRPDVYFSKFYEQTFPEFLAEFASQITRSACELAKRRTVYMLRPIPEMGFHVPKTLSRRMIFGMKDDLSITIEDYQKRNAWVWAAQDAARDQCGIKILDPIPSLCRDGRCYASQSGRPLYSDDNHLSEFGNKLLVPVFAQVFEANQK